MRFLSIAGMGASGKTTLAKKLCNNPHIRMYFDCKAWVCISQKWSTLDILSKIFGKVGGSTKMVHTSVGDWWTSFAGQCVEQRGITGNTACSSMGKYQQRVPDHRHNY